MFLPKKRIEKKKETKIICEYSERKKKAKVIDEYYTLFSAKNDI